MEELYELIREMRNNEYLENFECGMILIQLLENNKDLEYDLIENYNDLLNESHGKFLGYSASMIIKLVDDVRYRTGLYEFENDLVTNQEIIVANEKHYVLDKVKDKIRAS